MTNPLYEAPPHPWGQIFRVVAGVTDVVVGGGV